MDAAATSRQGLFSMLYAAYDAHRAALNLARATARAALQALDLLPAPLDRFEAVRRIRAAHQVFADTALTHYRLPFGIDTVEVDGHVLGVREEKKASTPFATLLHFAKDAAPAQPRVLVVAPMSGHFATLLTGTVRTLLADHDVYLTDWYNAREVSMEHGRFGLDEYLDHVMEFLRVLGPGVHVIAVCQPCVPVLAAAAVMAEARDRAMPASMTLMAGPIDVEVNPTAVNDLATSRPLSWFATNVIGTVPAGYLGAGRRVYPGFVQLSAFLAMNPQRHLTAHVGWYRDLVAGEREKARVTRAFYEEYFAVSDLAAEFYLETIEAVFQQNRLARGVLEWRGRLIRPAAITRTALVTVEGERDDICAIGQTMAAHDLCSNLPPYRKHHHLQAGVGHFGVFSGRRWESQVYPVVRNVIAANT